LYIAYGGLLTHIREIIIGEKYIEKIPWYISRIRIILPIWIIGIGKTGIWINISSISYWI